MQIDRFNFAQNFDQICLNIDRSSFVSFDCQFTGLVTNIQKIQGKFADHRQFYERIKQTALNFKILQIGLTTFIFDLKKRSYEAYSYNFYVLPFVNLPHFNNIMISQVQSLAFLSEHGIDWNRIFKKGIIPQRLIQPFQYHRHQYDKYYNQSENEHFFGAVDKQNISKISGVLEKIQQTKVEQIIDFRKQSVYNFFHSKYGNKLLLRKAKKTKQKFQFFVNVTGSFQDQGEDSIVFEKNQLPIKYVQKKNEYEKMDQKPQQSNSKQQTLQWKNQNKANQPTIEFLLKKISEKNIPIVGHFPSLDIGLIYHTYFQSLPQHYEEYCQKINKLFPQIYDTKVLSRRVANNFKGMKVSLKSLYYACQDPKTLGRYCNVVECTLSNQNQNRHSAGYDSYLTGYAFVGMFNYLINNDKGDSINFEFLQDLNNLIYSRETGEIYLRHPYCSKSVQYQRKIIIWNQTKQNQKWRQIAEKLSFQGSLLVTQDHGQTYFVFEEQNQEIEQILNKFTQSYALRGYNFRKIPRARDSYARSQQQLYYNS